MKRRVVVTGMGAVSPYGVGMDIFSKNIFAGKTGARMIEGFSTELLPTRFAAQLSMSNDDLDELVENQKSTKTLCRSAKFAVIAAAEAFKNSH